MTSYGVQVALGGLFPGLAYYEAITDSQKEAALLKARHEANRQK